jgi:branched-chain amino acid transport system substrate-binding protein
MKLHDLSRRAVLKGAGALGASVFAPAVHAATTLKLGYVSPRSGPLAAFSEPEDFLVKTFLQSVKGGVRIGGKSVDVEVIVKDSQSNPNRAAEVAKELIVQNEVTMMLVASTPETTNPVATQCEIEGVPCISTVAPWQPYFIGRQQNPADPKTWKPFESTFHFFWGLEDVVATFTSMWSQLQTNKSVGALFPNDGDGNAWGSPVGFPPVLQKLGYKLTDPGRYQDLTDDFSAQIAAFRNNEVEIVTGVVIPPDFTTFWNQANQKGFKPKIATIGKALLFPVSLEALGKSGQNLASEVWWTPTYPFKSAVSGVTAGELAKAYMQASGKPWTQQLGFVHALFELALDSLKRSADATDSKANIEAISKADLDTVVGHLAFGSPKLPPFARRNIAKTPLVGGQWRLRDNGKYEIVIVDNSNAPIIPTSGKMEALA